MAYILEVEHFNTFIVKGYQEAWHVEESRIKGGFNEVSADYGVRAHLSDKDFARENRGNSIIYSGIFNSRTRANQTNQFPSGQDITRSVDFSYGPIQLLFTEDDRLNIFQEEKVSWALIDKDAIYTAEGGRLSTAAERVIGDINYYTGNYGIGKNPESFVYFAGRKYFSDKPKGLFIRLSRDGITEISDYGMRDYMRDNTADATDIVGMWDMHHKKVIWSVIKPSDSFTIGFDENTNGWSSFYSFVTDEGGFSLDAKFFTFKEGDVWEHYTNSNYNNFYGLNYSSEIELIINSEPSINKSFNSVNYEGSDSWYVTDIETDTDTAFDIALYQANDQDLISSAFKKFDNKYHSNIMNNDAADPYEVSFGDSITGIKGYFMKIKLSNDATTYREIFAVASIYNLNSY